MQIIFDMGAAETHEGIIPCFVLCRRSKRAIVLDSYFRSYGLDHVRGCPVGQQSLNDGPATDYISTFENRKHEVFQALVKSATVTASGVMADKSYIFLLPSESTPS